MVDGGLEKSRALHNNFFFKKITKMGEGDFFPGLVVEQIADFCLLVD